MPHFEESWVHCLARVGQLLCRTDLVQHVTQEHFALQASNLVVRSFMSR